MIKLKILNGESEHWVEYFNSQAQADRWLSEEVARPYWSDGYQVVYENLGPTNEEKALADAADAQAEAARNVRRQSISEGKANVATMTLPEVKSLLQLLIEELGL
jgi:hypothetical protein